MSRQRTSLAMTGAVPQERLKKELGRVDRLLEEDPETALDLLLELDRKHPNRWEILSRLAETYYALQDEDGHLDVLELMRKLRPEDPDLGYALIAAYLLAGMPFNAYEAAGRALSASPHHPQAATFREMIQAVREDLARHWGPEGLDPDAAEDAEIIRLHERLSHDFSYGRYSEALESGEKLLRLRPDFLPALNNQSAALFHSGRWADALELQRRALELQPENAHALANMVEFLVRSGDPVAAQEYGERLRALTITDPAHLQRAAEAFVYLEEAEQILAILKAARETDVFRSTGEKAEENAELAARLLHLGAVAQFWKGNQEEARRLWKEAVKVDPDCTLAAENLQDLENPPGERHAPWPFSVQHWISATTAEALFDVLQRMGSKSSDEQLWRMLADTMQSHPESLRALPLLLRHGEPEDRQLAFSLCRMTLLPELLPVLREYALSDRGPDYLRYEAAAAAIRAGLLERDAPLRFSWKGEWREIRVLPYQISDDPTVTLPSAVERLLTRAQEALAERRGKEGEMLVRQAISKHGEAPILLQNLAVSLQAQGRRQEAREQLRHLRERFPDYPFGRLLAAQLAITEDGDLEEAERLLEPLVRQEELHSGELRALCQIEIMLELGRGAPSAAEPWLLAWESAFPDDALREHWQDEVAQAERTSPPSGMRRLKEFTASVLHRSSPPEA